MATTTTKKKASSTYDGDDAHFESAAEKMKAMGLTGKQSAENGILTKAPRKKFVRKVANKSMTK